MPVKKTKKQSKSRVSKPRVTAEKPRVLVNYIIDRSGSMAGRWKETLNGFNVFIEDLRTNKDVQYFFSLTCFDTVVDMPLVAVPIGKIDTSILASFGPRGGTALYDAVGMTLERTKTQASDFDKIIQVIVTDGEENSSCEWNKDTLHDIVDKSIATGKHTFTYLGAQPETWTDAAKAGLAIAGSTVIYDQNNIGATYRCVASSLNSFASSAMHSTSSLYTDFGDKTLMKAANLTVAGDPTEKK